MQTARLAVSLSPQECPGLHYPDVLAPWGAAMSADGVNADAGLMSNGPYSNMPIIWAWEYGDRCTSRLLCVCSAGL